MLYTDLTPHLPWCYHDPKEETHQETRMATKATKTIKQLLTYQPQHAAYFAATQSLLN
jgi:hypothetical protein